MIRSVSVAILVAGSLAAGELPVKEVVLYKNGVGYFRRGGELKAGESARLDFKAADMNDVLKSLTLFQEGAGKITGLRYDSSEPIERKLAEFPFVLGKGQTLSSFLDQLKGARVELATGSEKVAGTILSGREAPGSQQQPPREQVTLMLNSGELRTLDLAAVGSVRFPDPELQTQLKNYLGNLVAGRSKEKRSIYIDSTEGKGRRIIATYVIPTPVWKSSYRLVFPETGEPALEGWAIVDNTTGEDWSNVRLALVSGRPVSFISSLYEPKYVSRQTVNLPDEEAAAPELHRGALDSATGDVMAAQVMAAPAPAAPMMALEKAGRADRNLLAGARSSMTRMPAAVTSTIAATAEGREAGELFEYGFSSPVTVRKDESALLPFLQQKIAARKLLVYSGDGSEFPRNAAELTNVTGKTLDGGPITVYDANTYAGEALMETVKNSDKRLISYAVDQGTRITTRLDSSSDLIREIHVRRGLITTRSAIRETRTYTAHNVDQKPKTLVIEHAIRPSYKLIDMKPSETTSTAYRFEVKLSAGATEKLPVVEEHVYENTMALASYTPDVLVTVIQNKALSEAARAQLQKVIDQKRAVAANDNEIQRTEQQLNSLNSDEERVRRNIESLNRVSGQQEMVQKYARQLSDLETRLAALRDRQGELQKKKALLEAELNSLIEKMEF